MQEMTTATQPERKHLTKAQKLNVILGGIIAVLSLWIYILQAGAV